MRDKFKLIKEFPIYKKGRIFESFGGLVIGITCNETNEKINFNNKDYFKQL